MDLHNNPNMGTDLLEVKVRQLEDKINELTQNLGHVEQTVDGFSGEITTNELTVESLPGITPVASDSCIGFDENGKLIPVDPAAGFERWETAPIRARAIKPKNNAEVLIDTVLTLDNVSEETMNNSMVLTLDESGNVVKVDMLEKAQKKLTAGYNISIASDGTISCDIQTMSFKGSVETYADLPATGNVTGDVWNVIAISTNYCWNGSAWIAIGSSVDLSNYYTKAEVYTKTESNINFAPKSTTYTKTQTETNFVNRTFGTCSTSASIQEKTVSIPAITTLNAGCEIKVLFSEGNTAGTCAGTSSNQISEANAPTLKLNSFTAYPIKVGGEFAGEGFVNSGDVHTFVFDGSAWNDMTADVIYKGSTSNGNYAKKRNLLIEEWGIIDNGSDVRSLNKTLTFPILFSNTNYVCNPISRKDTSSYNTGGICVTTKTTSTIYIMWYGTSDTQKCRYIDWRVIGY